MKKNSILIVLFAVLIFTVMALALTKVIDETIGMCIALFLVVMFNLLVARVAYKNDVKIVMWLMIVFMVVGIVLLGVNIYTLFSNGGDKDYAIQVLATPNESEKTKLFSYDNRDYYTYNLESVDVMRIEEDKKYSLKEALENGYTTLDEILEEAIPNEGTSGYKIYYDGGSTQYENDEYSIVICGDAGDGDIVFTTYDYTYNSSICEN